MHLHPGGRDVGNITSRDPSTGWSAIWLWHADYRLDHRAEPRFRLRRDSEIWRGYSGLTYVMEGGVTLTRRSQRIRKVYRGAKQRYILFYNVTPKYHYRDIPSLLPRAIDQLCCLKTFKTLYLQFWPKQFTTSQSYRNSTWLQNNPFGGPFSNCLELDTEKTLVFEACLHGLDDGFLCICLKSVPHMKPRLKIFP